MSAVAGSVPTQGVALSEATTAKRRGPRGELGKGTRSDRVKAAWRSAMAVSGAPKHMVGLREWVRGMLKGTRTGPMWEIAADPEDLNGWLDTKTHLRTPEVKRAMKDAKDKKRAKPKKPSKDRRKAK